MLNESVIKVLKNGMWDLATCANGEPNVVPVAFNIIYNKNSPTSAGSEMNCKRNLNGSGGRREIGIPR